MPKSTALRYSECRFRTLVDAMSVVTWHCPPSGLHVKPQPSWMAFTGQTAEEMLGTGWTQAVHPDDLAMAARRWTEAVACGEPFFNEHRIRRHDGKWCWMSVYAAPIRDAGGQIVEWFGMNLNITERKQAEIQLQGHAEELARSNTELDAFTYSASHDLKEPLRGIHNYAHFLLEGEAPRLSESGQQQLATIQRLTRRMQQLIDCLAEYSRVGRMELDLQPIDLMEVLDQVREILQPRIVERAVALRLPATWPTISADRVLISQVFQNLVSNAIKYSDSKEPWVEVGCETGEPPTFYVRDNGIGIKPQHCDQIFQIFRRLHARDAYGGGTGAGLTITKKIIERHGGTIWVESTPGEGSTFYFTLGSDL